ncbi:MAG: STAS domain-containing protein [Spirochaetes bacterium]|nr:STAS domain-containing protein [Spirochaetota bacterium]
MEINIQDIDGYRQVVLKGEFSLYNVHELKEIILNSIDPDSCDMIVDLDGVSYMDSSALGVLFAAQKKLVTFGKDLFLSHVSREMRDIMNLAGIRFKNRDIETEL